jgi:SNF2 family DNA or RNA helicase
MVQTAVSTRSSRQAFEGRVISVLPVAEGFGITLGPGPHVVWYLARDPPNLGSRVILTAVVAEVKHIETRGRAGSVTVLDAATVRPSDVYPEPRVVAPEWYDLVRAAMRRPLYKYQEEGAAWLASRIALGEGSILADDMGLGKTSQAIAALVATRAFPCIIVCPASVRENWVRELGFAARVPSIEVVTGRRGLLYGAQVIICTYDVLLHRERQLASMRSRLIMFDEAQTLKEPKPAPRHRAAVATRLAHYIGCAIEMTGTPILNRPKELFRLLHIAAPKRWTSFEDFNDRYCKPQQDVGYVPDLTRRIVTNAGTAEHLDELQALVQPVMLRRLKSEVMQDLPAKSRRSIVVSLEAQDVAQYRAAERDVVAWLRAQGSDAKARSAAIAVSLVKFTHLRRLAAIGKLKKAIPDYLDAWFDRKDPEPLVVFAHHKEVLDGVFGIAYAKGIRAVGITGSDDIKKRQIAIDRFQEGMAQLFVASIQAGGIGITLHRACEMLILERDWVPSRLAQVEDRLHRAGQTRPVTITYMDAAGTIDERIAEVVAEKAKLINYVLDGTDGGKSGATRQAGATLEAVVDGYVRQPGGA